MVDGLVLKNAVVLIRIFNVSRARVLALVSIGLVGFMSSVAQAAPITYDLLSLTNGMDTLTGSITTDGTIGAISYANIMAWSFTDTGPAAFSMSSANPNFYQCQGASGCFTASPSTLTFDFRSTTTLDPHALFLQASTPLQGVINFYGAATTDCPPAGCVAVQSFTTAIGNFWYVPGPPDGVVGVVSTEPGSVPEPGTISLFAAGLFVLGLMRRKVVINPRSARPRSDIRSHVFRRSSFPSSDP